VDEVDELRAERDVLQRELMNLRAGLCHSLGKFRREPDGPQGLTVVSVLSDREIFDEIRRLRRIAEKHASGGGL
jgi:hypothetical protein